jgi:hypothetical protein
MPLTLPRLYFELRLEILDQKYVKKDKSNVVFYPTSYKFDVDLAIL